MIKFIPVEELLAVRNEVLREGRLTLSECIFPNDHAYDSFHLGYYVNGELACIASFHAQSYSDLQGNAYQLRGMATIEKYRGSGLGKQLVNFAVDHLRSQKVNYVWCNARQKAVKFYKSLGFEIISDEFEVKGIGPHYLMYLKIQ
jgi:predicted GNAT family N-acyltransferase